MIDKKEAWLCHITALCLSFPIFKTVIMTQPCPNGAVVGMCRV